MTQDALRRKEFRLRDIQATLLANFEAPLYFPFAFSDKRPVRAAQGYLVKFPAGILNAFAELADVPRPGHNPSHGHVPSRELGTSPV